MSPDRSDVITTIMVDPRNSNPDASTTQRSNRTLAGLLSNKDGASEPNSRCPVQGTGSEPLGGVRQNPNGSWRVRLDDRDASNMGYGPERTRRGPPSASVYH